MRMLLNTSAFRLALIFQLLLLAGFGNALTYWLHPTCRNYQSGAGQVIDFGGRVGIMSDVFTLARNAAQRLERMPDSYVPGVRGRDNEFARLFEIIFKDTKSSLEMVTFRSNPECEQLHGGPRTVRVYDFVHDTLLNLGNAWVSETSRLRSDLLVFCDNGQHFQWTPADPGRPWHDTLLNIKSDVNCDEDGLQAFSQWPFASRVRDPTPHEAENYNFFQSTITMCEFGMRQGRPRNRGFPVTHNNLRSFGSLRDGARLKTLEIVSQILFHEMMHSPYYCLTDVFDQDGDSANWSQVSPLSRNDAIRNAESYMMIALMAFLVDNGYTVDRNWENSEGRNRNNPKIRQYQDLA